ncbi:hypothetical protein [Anaerobiospirillum succiniciproducens]|uniref:hypothetical protein n=1 Tax=Anaerobiospirillum succiniciproducens TaxID=13335 RepID=UPI0023525851|nr:hypothetical protein [Anaerobiospirillum succiniciproducens]MCI6863472.1 hypothetical protein [Anaerobiospirillum succiniciproducens]
MLEKYLLRLRKVAFYFVCGLLLTFMVMGGIPTGWIYDLWVGEGTKIGQKPSSDVVLVESKEQALSFLNKDIAVTAEGDNLILCPLMRLRDNSEEGEHNLTAKNKKKIYIEKYRRLSYPVSLKEKAVNMLAFSGSYNSYYLLQLKDGSYLGVYFDDYLTFQMWVNGKIRLPTGRIRYTESSERGMLSRMHHRYGFDVNDLLLLDMYRHDKIPGILDKIMRFVVAILIAIFVLQYRSSKKKRKNSLEHEQPLK